MLFTLVQVIGALTVIRGVPEAQVERRDVLIIAFV